MSDDRFPENAIGPWYTKSNCIDCGMCPESSPAIFKRYDEGGYAVVHHQPSSEEEEVLALEAKESCPVDAICGPK